MRAFFILSIFSLIFLHYACYADDIKIRYFQTDSRYIYRIELLKLALDKTFDDYGGYQLIPSNENMTQARGLFFLRQGMEIDLAFLPTTIELEEQLLPIKIPILRGILGYRILLIHQDTLFNFSQIETFDQLKNDYIAGFGSDWADLKILHCHKTLQNLTQAGGLTSNNVFFTTDTNSLCCKISSSKIDSRE